jgi:hypothetical protein
MSAEPTPNGEGELAAPRYGAASLADLSVSVLASLGVPGEPNTLGLEPAGRVCVLLVDGLGLALLRRNREWAPFLAGYLDDAGSLSVGFPTTTATSLTSLGTGIAPGGHGILGYQVAVPGTERLMNQLRWDADIDPEEWQPRRTAFQRARAAGVSAAYVASGAFEHSGLTRAAGRGGSYRPANNLSEIVVKAAAALAEGERSYVFAYHADLDSLGHMFGSRSDYWRYQLGHVDRLAEQLAAAAPAGTMLYVTADHGMVDISEHGRIDVEQDADFADGVRLLGGEPRVRHVYTRPGAAEDVRAAWRTRLEGRAVVLSRQEAVDAGWFGPVDAEISPRIGDVVAATYGDTALVAPATETLESQLVGMHGSLTRAELDVPLLRLDGRDT